DPAWNKTNLLNSVRQLGEDLRRTIRELENGEVERKQLVGDIDRLRKGLELVDQQAALWENGRQCFAQMGEAIDQLSRVSNGMQRGVLDARMVQVSPLFTRFRRLVRDFSLESGKQVQLVIEGEKTELDKRMIDALGEPLVHLVRNSIDHGLELPDDRTALGKPETGRVVLSARHRGNSVHIEITDDGRGINSEKIKSRLVDNGVLDSATELTDAEALEYIWHPGFSTAHKVTDVSGRGVGMDAVRTRINQLNGTIDVKSSQGQGTTFTIRLPLTLAIIHCLLVRLNDEIFSIPVDDVREIVSIDREDVVAVLGNRTFKIRGEYLPLMDVKEVFQWQSSGEATRELAGRADSDRDSIDVVILQSGETAIGLRVEELLGSQDIVIKSLSDNFRSVRGLSGASVLGDGSVSLMLDVASFVTMARRPSKKHPGDSLR
ncbi:MAG: chemotaxis protein CheA, partial [Pirellulaceae bacterium]